jgi:hypothetical protein
MDQSDHDLLGRQAVQQQHDGAPGLAGVRLSDNPADRRAHPRIPSARLPFNRVHIPQRATVSLVDMSSGGALLELPFQMRPESRFTVKIDTPVEQVEVPIQLLRCYVAQLKGGIIYHAAGAFDSVLNLDALARRASPSGQRLLGSLERLHQVVKTRAAQSRSDAAFEEILSAAIAALRRGESIDLVTLKVKAHLTQTYPSLRIVPALLPTREQAASVQGFGLTFTSKFTLSVHDRRLLKSNAQLIAMLEESRRDTREDFDASSQVIDSAAGRVPAQPTPATQLGVEQSRSAVPRADAKEAQESLWKMFEPLTRAAAL